MLYCTVNLRAHASFLMLRGLTRTYPNCLFTFNLSYIREYLLKNQIWAHLFINLNQLFYSEDINVRFYLVDYLKWYNILCLYEINTYSNTFISYNVINCLTYVYIIFYCMIYLETFKCQLKYINNKHLEIK